MLVFVDVDGTAFEAEGETTRPFLLEFCRGVSERGAKVVLWTGGGKDYGTIKFRRLPEEIQTHIVAVHGKAEPALRDFFARSTERRFFVDDVDYLVQAQQSAGHGGFVVPMFDNPAKQADDRALLDALVELDRYLNAN